VNYYDITDGALTGFCVGAVLGCLFGMAAMFLLLYR